MVTYTDIIGYIAGVLVVLCLIPQLYHTIVNKNVEHISLLTYVILFVGDILWITYGFLLNDLRIIFPNFFAAIAVLCMIIMCIIFKEKETRTINSNI